MCLSLSSGCRENVLETCFARSAFSWLLPAMGLWQWILVYWLHCYLWFTLVPYRFPDWVISWEYTDVVFKFFIFEFFECSLQFIM
jgi:hypothetical protein